MRQQRAGDSLISEEPGDGTAAEEMSQSSMHKRAPHPDPHLRANRLSAGLLVDLRHRAPPLGILIVDLGRREGSSRPVHGSRGPDAFSTGRPGGLRAQSRHCYCAAAQQAAAEIGSAQPSCAFRSAPTDCEIVPSTGAIHSWCPVSPVRPPQALHG